MTDIVIIGGGISGLYCAYKIRYSSLCWSLTSEDLKN